MCIKPEELFIRNEKWAKKKLEEDSEYFTRLSEIQRPNYLWIGCSDSRVPANEIVGMDPGELFVHRNVANVVPHSDANCLAVIQYAVEVLGVEHISVTGHYGCGGIRAALGDKDHGQIDNWLANIKDVLRNNYAEIEAIPDENDKVDRLCELNVIQQVRNVAKTSIIQKAWRNKKNVTIHGWIYGLTDGRMRDLKVDITGNDQIHPAYRINS
ncbi:carbonate dehydratase [Sneathiella chinensis]|uniref:carbonic anhydrase n=1 Tax=Sneathiella chinensis TaxID=349750 RepID=A0ABQ5U3K3_9PROT|nr:carbonate dehydratase [Sneathiella chinensis]GLQ06652.1 carbonic anhydrase [Sneathiella chinensis]